MSWWVTGALAVGGAVSGIYGAEAKRKSDKEQGKENQRVRKESLLTAKYNIRQNNKASAQKQMDMLEQGGRALAEVAAQGQKQQGEVIAEAGGSGSVVSSGTTLDVMMTDAINNTVQQHSVVEATKDSLANEKNNNANMNQTMWRNAKLGNERSGRQLALNDKASGDTYLANILSSLVGGGKIAASGYTPTKKSKQVGTGDQHGG